MGVALVAEVMPDHARPYALGMVQALSAVGNMMAAVIGIILGQRNGSGAMRAPGGTCSWPARSPPRSPVVFKELKEPEEWLKARAAEDQMGSFERTVRRPRWRRNTIVGMVLAFAGVVGLWGIGFFSYDLIRPVLERTFRAQGSPARPGRQDHHLDRHHVPPPKLRQLLRRPRLHLAHRMTIGRKPAFAVSFVPAMGIDRLHILVSGRLTDIFWMIPLMGFSQLALFGGYAIYLPELFPTRLRSTGTSFCYNVGRMVAAAGPLTLGL